MSEITLQTPPAGLAIDYEDLFQHAPCGYLILLPDGRILQANETLARWVGSAAATLVGKRFRDLLTLPGRIVYETNFAPMLRLEGGLEEFALDLTTASGEAAPMLASAVETRDADGGLAAIKVVLARAKDRRGYERDLRTREIAAVERLDDERQAAELREQFIAVLGHDLRNPLASIRAGATLLARVAVEPREAKVLALMHASVDRMAALIDNVLDFARGRLGGGLSVARAACHLQPAIEHVIEELRAAHPDRVILSELELHKDVDCDAGRLAQLVSNLVGNAVIHGAADQPVKISAGIEDGELEIRVCNGGAPIPAAALPKLFLPFERGAIRPNRHGLGLGLYISSEIARAHGGRLEVTSGKTGTVFTFAMPLSNEGSTASILQSF